MDAARLRQPPRVGTQARSREVAGRAVHRPPPRVRLGPYTGALQPIDPMEWCAREATSWLSGFRYMKGPDGQPISENRVLVREDEQPAESAPEASGTYLSPFMQLMLAAVRHFKITDTTWQKKKPGRLVPRAEAAGWDAGLAGPGALPRYVLPPARGDERRQQTQMGVEPFDPGG